MSREFARSRRVAEQLQRTLAEILRRELKDPRVANASITEVEVSGDLAHARVYFSLLPPDADPAPALAGLESASGFLRRKLARALKLRHIPALHFAHDDSIARGAALTHLIDEVVDRDRMRDRGDPPDESE
jgi:ribosome-binding factor A